MTTNDSEYQKRLRLFQEHMDAAERSATMLATFHAKVLTRYPLHEADVHTLDADHLMPIYALFKKYEQLIVLMNDNILKNIPYFDLENTGKMSRFDTIIYAEKAGILRSAQRFVDAVALRNQLTHEYPLDESKQTQLINAVIVEADVLLQAFGQLKAYVQSRLPTWLQVRAGAE